MIHGGAAVAAWNLSRKIDNSQSWLYKCKYIVCTGEPCVYVHTYVVNTVSMYCTMQTCGSDLRGISTKIWKGTVNYTTSLATNWSHCAYNRTGLYSTYTNGSHCRYCTVCMYTLYCLYAQLVRLWWCWLISVLLMNAVMLSHSEPTSMRTYTAIVWAVPIEYNSFIQPQQHLGDLWVEMPNLVTESVKNTYRSKWSILWPWGLHTLCVSETEQNQCISTMNATTSTYTCSYCVLVLLLSVLLCCCSVFFLPSDTIATIPRRGTLWPAELLQEYRLPLGLLLVRVHPCVYICIHIRTYVEDIWNNVLCAVFDVVDGQVRVTLHFCHVHTTDNRKKLFMLIMYIRTHPCSHMS